MNSPANPITPATPANAQVDIDALDVSDRWKTYFKGMQAVGGLSMHRLKTLPPEERKAAFKAAQPPISSFALAFVFSIFYYIFKGMWKKGLVLLAIVLPIIIVLSVVLSMIGLDWAVNGLRFVAGVVFGMMAPRDFYATKVLGDDGWMPAFPSNKDKP